MNGGQVILNGITDSQLEALLEVKKTHEGEFQLANLQCLGGPGFPSAGPMPNWCPGSPWGMGPGHPGQWFGPGSPWGPLPPNLPPQPPGPAQAQSTYNATLSWQQDQGFRAIAAVFDRIATAA